MGEILAGKQAEMWRMSRIHGDVTVAAVSQPGGRSSLPAGEGETARVAVMGSRDLEVPVKAIACSREVSESCPG